MCSYGITSAMNTFAEEYDNDMKGMIALYVLTIGVEPIETIATFGIWNYPDKMEC